METRHFIVATAGHVDHGKSALVRALTGTDPDRLPAERARGITIDLGFASLDLPDPAPPPGGRLFALGLVDVPGHEDFVKNMVAGVGAVDVALFVVAADDGWMPQSEEHLQILAYLGVRRAVAALTKIDLVDGAGEQAALESVAARLRGSPFEDAPVVPVSVRTGRGLDELRAALASVLAQTPPPRDAGKPRLPVDRVFTLRGVGTVVTGTLGGGSLATEQTVVLQPSGRVAHVRSLQSHGQSVERAGPGTRVALNLPELPATGEGAPVRGETVMLAGQAGGTSRALDVRLVRTGRDGDKAAPLRDGTHVWVHHGSARWRARVRLAEGGELPPGGSAVAQLHAGGPVHAFAGDRLLLRDDAGRHTLAGGIVLDPDGRPRRFRTAARRRFLARRAEANPADAGGFISALLEREGGLALDSAALAKSPFSADEIAGAVARLAEDGAAVAPAPGMLADPAWWRAALAEAALLVDALHREHPERPGLTTETLRAASRRRLPRAPTWFDALLAALTAPGGGFVRAGTALRRASHRLTLPPALQAAGERIRRALAEGGLEPPGVRELAPDATARQALRFLLDTGEVVEIGPELVLTRERLQRTRAAVARFLRTMGPATASDLRQMLGTTRRVMIPLLEYFDRTSLTRREGDRRVLR